MDRSLKLILEALLFASERPLSAREIHSWFPDESLSTIKDALNQLCAEYEAMGRSFTLKEVAEGYQFRTVSEYAPYVLRMFKANPTRLSRPAMETLAIVAYKQPILRQEIERLRGVDVGGPLRTLLEKSLIKVVGRKSLPGKPLIYGTTKRFLEVFDLKDIDSLPRLTEIKALGTAENEITSPTTTGEEIQEGTASQESAQPAQESGSDDEEREISASSE